MEKRSDSKKTILSNPRLIEKVETRQNTVVAYASSMGKLMNALRAVRKVDQSCSVAKLPKVSSESQFRSTSSSVSNDQPSSSTSESRLDITPKELRDEMTKVGAFEVKLLSEDYSVISPSAETLKSYRRHTFHQALMSRKQGSDASLRKMSDPRANRRGYISDSQLGQPRTESMESVYGSQQDLDDRMEGINAYLMEIFTKSQQIIDDDDDVDDSNDPGEELSTPVDEESEPLFQIGVPCSKEFKKTLSGFVPTDD